MPVATMLRETHTSRVLVWLALLVLLITVAPALADNCSGGSDCANTQGFQSATLAALFALLAVAASIGLDFIPVVGEIKSLMEAVRGVDTISGARLAWWERGLALLGAIPLAGVAFRGLRTAVRGARGLDRAADALRAADRAGDALSGAGLASRGLRTAIRGARGPDRAADAARAADRAGDALRGADRAADAARAVDDVPLVPHSSDVPRGGHGPTPRIPDEFGTHLGQSSGRPFFPDEIGLPIERLSTEGVEISTEGIARVRQHTSRFGPDDMNDIMQSRLDDIAAGRIEPTQYDLNYYTHELRESDRYTALGHADGVPPDADAAHRLWNNTHTATLEDYGLTDADLYHPSARPR